MHLLPRPTVAAEGTTNMTKRRKIPAIRSHRLIMVSQPQTYRFGEYTLEAGEHRLLRKSADVELRPKAFDTLLYLVTRHGHTVPKNELLDAVWAGTYVSEAVLTHCPFHNSKTMFCGSDSLAAGRSSKSATIPSGVLINVFVRPIVANGSR